MSRKVLSIIILVSILVVGVFGIVSAQDYPTKPVQFIVPWSPGGGSDTLMRIVAKYLEENIGEAVPVINKPGVSGTLGLQELKEKPANGYHIGQIHEGLLAAYHVGITDLNYNDFTPVASMTNSPQFLAVRADAPYNNLEEFIEYAKANPGEISFGVTLKGIPHIWTAILESKLDTKFRYVGYEGTGERVQALAGGFIDAGPIDYASGIQFVESGKFKFIAFAAEERSGKLPDLPTFAEEGYEIIWSVQRGIVVPKGTPQDVIDVLEKGLRETAENEDFVTDVEKAGGEVKFRGQENYINYLETLDKDIAAVADQIEQ